MADFTSYLQYHSGLYPNDRWVYTPYRIPLAGVKDLPQVDALGRPCAVSSKLLGLNKASPWAQVLPPPNALSGFHDLGKPLTVFEHEMGYEVALKTDPQQAEEEYRYAILRVREILNHEMSQEAPFDELAWEGWRHAVTHWLLRYTYNRNDHTLSILKAMFEHPYWRQAAEAKPTQALEVWALVHMLMPGGCDNIPGWEQLSCWKTLERQIKRLRESEKNGPEWQRALTLVGWAEAACRAQLVAPEGISSYNLNHALEEKHLHRTSLFGEVSMTTQMFLKNIPLMPSPEVGMDDIMGLCGQRWWSVKGEEAEDYQGLWTLGVVMASAQPKDPRDVWLSLVRGWLVSPDEAILKKCKPAKTMEGAMGQRRAAWVRHALEAWLRLDEHAWRTHGKAFWEGPDEEFQRSFRHRTAHRLRYAFGSRQYQETDPHRKRISVERTVLENILPQSVDEIEAVLGRMAGHEEERQQAVNVFNASYRASKRCMMWSMGENIEDGWGDKRGVMFPAQLLDPQAAATRDRRLPYLSKLTNALREHVITWAQEQPVRAMAWALHQRSRSVSWMLPFRGDLAAHHVVSEDVQATSEEVMRVMLENVQALAQGEQQAAQSTNAVIRISESKKFLERHKQADASGDLSLLLTASELVSRFEHRPSVDKGLDLLGAPAREVWSTWVKQGLEWAIRVPAWESDLAAWQMQRAWRDQGEPTLPTVKKSRF